MDVSKVCLGTMTWGEQNSEAEAHTQLDYSIDKGINFIDTAEMYPVPPNGKTQGRTEEYLGTWLAKQSRDKLFIATKIAGPGRRDWVRGGRTDLTKRICANTKGSPICGSDASFHLRKISRSALTSVAVKIISLSFAVLMVVRTL